MIRVPTPVISKEKFQHAGVIVQIMNYLGKEIQSNI